jgi:putative NADH-flavin reductase
MTPHHIDWYPLTEAENRIRATGSLLTEHLLDRGNFVKAIVCSADRLPESVRNHDNLSVIEASVLDLSDAELNEHVKGCDAVASCLGHPRLVFEIEATAADGVSR